MSRAMLIPTRPSQKDGKGKYNHDEKYLGEVICAEEGGRVHPTSRVAGITG
jgi:hypothetical protein